jgi:hypothetical protein
MNPELQKEIDALPEIPPEATLANGFAGKPDSAGGSGPVYGKGGGPQQNLRPVTMPGRADAGRAG